MSAVISEDKRIIQFGREAKRSPVQTPTESKITTKCGQTWLIRGSFTSKHGERVHNSSGHPVSWTEKFYPYRQ